MGDRIDFRDGRWGVPDRPVIPFIEGDGTGPDIWRASRRVFDAVVEKVSRGKRRVEWLEVLAGEKAFQQTGNWLPEETLENIRRYRVAIKGPLTTPVGGGIRSLNVALRQLLDLDRKSTRLNSSHSQISYAVFCLKKKKKHIKA